MPDQPVAPGAPKDEKSASEKPVFVTGRIKEQFLSMNKELAIFMRGARLALEVPDTWMFDPNELAYVPPGWKPPGVQGAK